MITRKTNYLIALGFVLLMASCGKNGAVGPQGAVGTSGATGAKGTTGSSVENVTYSDWVTPTFKEYKLGSGQIIDRFRCDIPASAIKAGIIDSGTVVVYGKLSNALYPILWPANQIGKLPIELYYQNPGSVNVTDTWIASITPGHIQIDYFNSTNTTTTASDPGAGHSFRYVIIPGGNHPFGSINPKNYQQVIQALHIPN